MFPLFLQGALLSLPAIVVPSPFKVFLISQALKNGWRRTLIICAVPPFLDAFIVGFVLFVLGRSPAWLVSSIRLAGGFFILYLASKLIRLIQSGEIGFKPSEEAARQSIRQAVGVNLLNPNPYLISGMVLGPMIVQAAEISWLHGITVYVGFYGIFFLGLCTITIAFGSIGQINPKVNYWLLVVATIGLAFLGVYNLWIGVMELVGSW